MRCPPQFSERYERIRLLFGDRRLTRLQRCYVACAIGLNPVRPGSIAKRSVRPAAWPAVREKVVDLGAARTLRSCVMFVRVHHVHHHHHLAVAGRVELRAQ